MSSVETKLTGKLYQIGKYCLTEAGTKLSYSQLRRALLQLRQSTHIDLFVTKAEQHTPKALEAKYPKITAFNSYFHAARIKLRLWVRWFKPLADHLAPIKHLLQKATKASQSIVQKAADTVNTVKSEVNKNVDALAALAQNTKTALEERWTELPKTVQKALEPIQELLPKGGHPPAQEARPPVKAKPQAQAPLAERPQVSNNLEAKPQDNTPPKQATPKADEQFVTLPKPVVESKPEPVIESKPDPVVESKPEPVIESKPEPVVESKPDPVIESKPEPVVESKPDPVIESKPDPVIESKPEPVIESKPEPVVESKPEPVVESKPDPVVESKPEPVVESKPEPVVESKPERVVESKPEPVIESKPEPVIESKPEPVIESKPEPVIESKPEPVIESKPEPVVESKPDPVVESKPDPVVESKPDPVVESKPEPVVESKPEPVVESKPDPVVESKPDPVVESKPEPVIESKPEPVIESKPEPVVELKPNASFNLTQWIDKNIASTHPERGLQIRRIRQLWNAVDPNKPEKLVQAVSNMIQQIEGFSPAKLLMEDSATRENAIAQFASNIKDLQAVPQQLKTTQENLNLLKDLKETFNRIHKDSGEPKAETIQKSLDQAIDLCESLEDNLKGVVTPLEPAIVPNTSAIEPTIKAPDTLSGEDQQQWLVDQIKKNDPFQTVLVHNAIGGISSGKSPSQPVNPTLKPVSPITGGASKPTPVIPVPTKPTFNVDNWLQNQSDKALSTTVKPLWDAAETSITALNQTISQQMTPISGLGDLAQILPKSAADQEGGITGFVTPLMPGEEKAILPIVEQNLKALQTVSDAVTQIQPLTTEATPNTLQEALTNAINFYKTLQEHLEDLATPVVTLPTTHLKPTSPTKPVIPVNSAASFPITNPSPPIAPGFKPATPMTNPTTPATPITPQPTTLQPAVTSPTASTTDYALTNIDYALLNPNHNPALVRDVVDFLSNLNPASLEQEARQFLLSRTPLAPVGELDLHCLIQLNSAERAAELTEIFKTYGPFLKANPTQVDALAEQLYHTNDQFTIALGKEKQALIKLLKALHDNPKYNALRGRDSIKDLFELLKTGKFEQDIQKAFHEVEDAFYEASHIPEVKEIQIKVPPDAAPNIVAALRQQGIIPPVSVKAPEAITPVVDTSVIPPSPSKVSLVKPTAPTPAKPSFNLALVPDAEAQTFVECLENIQKMSAETLKDEKIQEVVYAKADPRRSHPSFNEAEIQQQVQELEDLLAGKTPKTGIFQRIFNRKPAKPIPTQQETIQNSLKLLEGLDTSQQELTKRLEHLLTVLRYQDPSPFTPAKLKVLKAKLLDRKAFVEGLQKRLKESLPADVRPSDAPTQLNTADALFNLLEIKTRYPKMGDRFEFLWDFREQPADLSPEGVEEFCKLFEFPLKEPQISSVDTANAAIRGLEDAQKEFFNKIRSFQTLYDYKEYNRYLTGKDIKVGEGFGKLNKKIHDYQNAVLDLCTARIKAWEAERKKFAETTAKAAAEAKKKFG